MLIKDVTFVVVDVETTGFSPRDGGITEIAMVKVKNGRLMDEFTSLVNPLIPIPYSITRLTGIDDALVADAPTEEEIAPTVHSFLGDGVFTAHNVSFDLGFVNGTLSKGRIPHISNQQFCTCKLARKLLPHLPSKSLGDVTDELCILHSHRHRAAGDAYVTAQVLIHFLDRLKSERNVETLEELFSYQ
ncbi:MAG: exonuclease domain-containing protein [Bacteroidota bacterium]|nr:exonuclease domain-containing protein [Bacteroidota bacterium]